MRFFNLALEFPVTVIPAQAGIHCSNWAPDFTGLAIFKGRVNSALRPLYIVKARVGSDVNNGKHKKSIKISFLWEKDMLEFLDLASGNKSVH